MGTVGDIRLNGGSFSSLQASAKRQGDRGRIGSHQVNLIEGIWTPLFHVGVVVAADEAGGRIEM